MGLDMYAWQVKPEYALGDFEVARGEDDENCLDELHYWRKHHDLHGWMERLYREKGGDSPDFNCVKVRLTLEDLDRLEKTVLANQLPQTTGFFFGNNPPDEDSIRYDMEFIGKAKATIAGGMAVYYDSWW